ncbi:peroxiredoxin-6 [Parasteatoda tepidariorum]|uniref:1-Cys peroxiredoxin n=1 Tax=Parasteatoda tepidariorum TaxID=114398 RepID=A0A2L2Y558_PARTP|nr:peroxiredoxin-6 [Parasteatoda tepidariorum]
MVNLGDLFPNFSADTTVGKIQFHDWIGESWAILFSHPADFTPVCTTELGRAAELAPEFEKRDVKLIALSCDDVLSHKKWTEDIKAYACLKDVGFPFPIIADEKRELAVQLGMIDPDEKDKDGLPLTARAVFIVGPDKRLKLSMLYPATTGRNFDEILRVVDSLQLTRNQNVATPVDWKQGEDCMVLPNIKEADLPTLFPKGVRVKEMPSGKPYLRLTPQPNA